ncbi:MAG TPA: hypothetical protein VFF68_09885, partial [Anaerolineaceae bacterium]|nr:hypothetical protein [Anaerolineaceae bacterium]
MKEGEYLRSIEASWQSTAVLRVTHGSNSSQAVSEQMARFFEALVGALETGAANCLDPVLTDWCSAQTESDLNGQPNSVIAILKAVMTLTGEVCQERLDPAVACRVNSALIPIFAYAFEKVSQETIDARVTLETSRLDEIRQDLER